MCRRKGGKDRGDQYTAIIHTLIIAVNFRFRSFLWKNIIAGIKIPARRALRGSTPNYVVATYYFANEDCIENFTFQRLGGVEPLHQAWEARILPLYYSRVGKNHHS